MLASVVTMLAMITMLTQRTYSRLHAPYLQSVAKFVVGGVACPQQWLPMIFATSNPADTSFVRAGPLYEYVHESGRCVKHENIGTKTAGKKTKECAALCDDYGAGCKGFEFGVDYNGGGSYKAGDCQLSSASLSAQPKDCDGINANLDFYTKIPSEEAGPYEFEELTCVSGNNIAADTGGSAYPGSTVDQCKTRCDTYGDGCKGFEMGRTTSTADHVKPWDCRLQSSAVTTGCSAKYVDFYGKVFPSSPPSLVEQVQALQILSKEEISSKLDMTIELDPAPPIVVDVQMSVTRLAPSPPPPSPPPSPPPPSPPPPSPPPAPPGPPPAPLSCTLDFLSTDQYGNHVFESDGNVMVELVAMLQFKKDVEDGVPPGNDPYTCKVLEHLFYECLDIASPKTLGCGGGECYSDDIDVFNIRGNDTSPLFGGISKCSGKPPLPQPRPRP